MAHDGIKLGNELTRTMHDLRLRQQRTVARSQDCVEPRAWP